MVEREEVEREEEPGDQSRQESQATATSEVEPDTEDIPVLLRLTLSIVAGLPLVVVGITLLVFDTDVAAWAALLITLVGALLVGGGIYFSLLGSTPRLDLMPGERTLVLRHPSVKPPFARMMLSLPFFAGAGYFLIFAEQSYAVLYFVLFLVAMYLYLFGLIRYWLNHHTTYYITNRRAVRMYRFLWLHTIEIPIKSVNAISESRGFFEMVTGRGNVVVASGIADTHKVRIQEIGNPGPVARTVRELVQ